MIAYSSDVGRISLVLDLHCLSLVEGDSRVLPHAHRLALWIEENAAAIAAPDTRGVIAAPQDSHHPLLPLPRLSRLLLGPGGWKHVLSGDAQRFPPSTSFTRALFSHYLWRDRMNLIWKPFREGLLLAAFEGSGSFIPRPPPGVNLTPAVVREIEAAWVDLHAGPAVPLRMEGVLEEEIPALRAAGWTIRRSGTEYIHPTSDAADLRGNRFKGERNAANKFERHSRPALRDLRSGDIPAALVLYWRWLGRNPERLVEGSFRRLLAEDSLLAYKRALHEASDLGIMALVAEAGGKIAGISLSARIGPELACIFFELADPDHPGAAPFLFRAAARVHRGASRLSSMDDSGLPELARAKGAGSPQRVPLYQALSGRAGETGKNTAELDSAEEICDKTVTNHSSLHPYPCQAAQLRDAGL
ncbi:MAG: phosphatidylglycerol lysyltransferase domain-containing protein [Nitrospirota bacterium]|mgnify:FL=1